MIDVTKVDPDALEVLTDEEFRVVVNADLRRRMPRQDATLSEEVSEALRRGDMLDRWYQHLVQMLKSVEGQLDANADEYEATQATVNSQILNLERKLETGDRVVDGNRELTRREAEDKLASLRMRLESDKADYLYRRAATIRFKTGLDQHLAEAHMLRDRERETLADRAIRLTEAVKRHRSEIVADLDEDDEPGYADRSLWAVLDDED